MAEVGVPAGVAHVEVPVAVAVVEVVPQNVARQPLYARVVDQGAEVRVLVDERDDGRPLLVVVRLAVMSPAALGEYRLEGLRDPSYVVGEQPRKVEVPEGLEERDLLVGEVQLRVLCCGIRLIAYPLLGSAISARALRASSAMWPSFAMRCSRCTMRCSSAVLTITSP